MAISYMSKFVQLYLFDPNCILILTVYTNYHARYYWILDSYFAGKFGNGQLTLVSMNASCNDLTAFSQSTLFTTKAKLSSEDP